MHYPKITKNLEKKEYSKEYSTEIIYLSMDAINTNIYSLNSLRERVFDESFDIREKKSTLTIFVPKSISPNIHTSKKILRRQKISFIKKENKIIKIFEFIKVIKAIAAFPSVHILNMLK